MSRKARIQQQLTDALLPDFINVEDESGNHHVPEGAETHFKVVVVSPRFDNLTRIERHKLVNTLLKVEFERGMHALSMHLYTTPEWDLKNQTVVSSPNCRDGYKHKLK